ncbi:hypothetical protein V1524DRAFT_462361 [Lipomyces starkeyi]
MAVTSFYAYVISSSFQDIMAGLYYMDRTGFISPNITGISGLCDKLGRRYSMRIGGLIYFSAAFTKPWAQVCFIVGRTIQGFRVGFLLFYFHSYATSSWVDHGFFFISQPNMSWQSPHIVQCSIAFLLLSLSMIVPGTPRLLAANGFATEALQTLANFHGNGRVEHDEVQDLGVTSWTEMSTTYRKVNCLLNSTGSRSILQHLCQNADFSTEKSLLYDGCSWGRLPLLMFGSIAIALALMRANRLFGFVIIYNTIFGATWGPIPSLLPAEVMRARAKGMALKISPTGASILRLVSSLLPLFNGYLLSHHRRISPDQFGDVETAKVTLEEIAIQFGDRAFEHEGQLVLQEMQNFKSAASKV